MSAPSQGFAGAAGPLRMHVTTLYKSNSCDSPKPKAPIEKRSHGIVPGVIQIPPNGQPIIQMRDAQTSGGYPKIATVIRADLWRVGQARLGGKLRFGQTAYADALAAEAEISAYLDRLRTNVRLVEESRTCRSS